MAMEQIENDKERARLFPEQQGSGIVWVERNLAKRFVDWTQYPTETLEERHARKKAEKGVGE